MLSSYMEWFFREGDEFGKLFKEKFSDSLCCNDGSENWRDKFFQAASEKLKDVFIIGDSKRIDGSTSHIVVEQTMYMN